MCRFYVFFTNFSLHFGQEIAIFPFRSISTDSEAKAPTERRFLFLIRKNLPESKRVFIKLLGGISKEGRLLQEAAVFLTETEFFKKYFPEFEYKAFTCHSWLLYPWNLEVLGPGSNLAAFIGDFEIVESADYENYQEVWRLFDCHYTGSAANLPADSSLRRAYADRIAKGEPIGYGRGFFRYR